MIAVPKADAFPSVSGEEHIVMREGWKPEAEMRLPSSVHDSPVGEADAPRRILLYRTLEADALREMAFRTHRDHARASFSRKSRECVDLYQES